jgi:hypothetical protein
MSPSEHQSKQLSMKGKICVPMDAKISGELLEQKQDICIILGVCFQILLALRSRKSNCIV